MFRENVCACNDCPIDQWKQCFEYAYGVDIGVLPSCGSMPMVPGSDEQIPAGQPLERTMPQYINADEIGKTLALGRGKSIKRQATEIAL